MVVKAENLVKKFGSFKAVNGIKFDIEKGEIFGLLGPNGAGKTTTIRMLIGILEPTSGNAYIEDYDVQKDPIKAKQLLGVVPEMANAYTDLSALKNLLFMGELYGISKEDSFKRAEKLLKLFNIYENKNQKVKTFSKGMKQRVILGMALMNDPKILFLDEPTSGLDVESSRIIKKVINELNSQGATILLTTHNIEEANQFCDRVAIMNRGKIIVIDRPENLRNKIQSASSVEVAFRKKVDIKELKFEIVSEVKKAGDKLRLYTKTPGQLIPLLVKYAEQSKNEIVSLNTLSPSLEDVFIKLTRDFK